MPEGQKLGIRGIMLDPARLVERHEFYFDLLPRLANWGFNTLWWHFVDDQGFVLQLDKHPELATPHALSKDETRRLIDRAGELGIDVVPEVETLGHANYITRLDRYAHLRDGTSLWKNACCPSHPQTLELMAEIVAEVAELFGSEYFHAGLDEVDFSGCDRCEERGRGKPGWWIYAEHTKAIHEIVTGLGKRMLMWADHVEHDPELIDVLPKDIVMVHWQYWDVEAEKIRRSVDAGFEVICAPAMSWHGTMIQPKAANLKVMDRMAETAAGLGDRCLGMVNTWWTAWRLVRDAALFAAAYTGEILQRGGPAEKADFARRFAREQFGLDDDAAADALWRAHELACDLPTVQTAMFDSLTDLVDAVALAQQDDFAGRADAMDACVATLAAAREKVSARREEYDAVVLAARLSAVCYHGPRAVLAAYHEYRAATGESGQGRGVEGVCERLTAAREPLAALQAELDEAYDALCAEWDRTRYPDDEKKAVADAALPHQGDMLLGRLASCRAYNRRLIARFAEAIDAYRAGGPFPGWP